MGLEFLVLQDSKVLEIDYPAMWVSLTLINGTLRNDKRKFYVTCYFIKFKKF